nr:unnamed protein product [Callosobruchus analis]
MKFITLTLTLFAIAAIFVGVASAACGPNEHVPICRPCAVTCADQDKICTAICIPNNACYCRPGYLKKLGCGPHKRCGPNEHVPGCRPCAVTCEEQHKPCSKICIHNTKCYCKPQYLKKNGACVPISQC